LSSTFGYGASPREAERVNVVKKLARVIADAVERFFSHQCPQLAAGIAYRVLFSIAPLAIVLVSIFGLVLQDDSVRHDVVNAIVDELPVSRAGRKDVEDAITEIATPASAAGFASLLVFGWAATGMMAAIRQGLERALDVAESRPAARGKLVDLALVLGAALLVLTTVGITLLGSFVQRGAANIGAGTLAGWFTHSVSFVLSIVVVLLLYRFVPTRGLRFRDALVGAILTAVLLRLIALASGYIYDRTTRMSVVYASLTSALVFLYSTYLYASALLFGAEAAAAWSLPPGPGSGEPIVKQLKRAVLGLFVREKPPATAAETPARCSLGARWSASGGRCSRVASRSSCCSST
jgi:membrane protein